MRAAVPALSISRKNHVAFDFFKKGDLERDSAPFRTISRLNCDMAAPPSCCCLSGAGGNNVGFSKHLHQTSN